MNKNGFFINPIRLILKCYFNTNGYRRLVDGNIKRAVELNYYATTGRYPNWDNPTTLNEKILWLETFSDTKLWTLYADKYEVRQILEKRGLKKYLTKFFGVWDDVNDINFNELPQRFVIKCTHDTGSTIIVDKEKCNIECIKKSLKIRLKSPFGYKTCEPHYTKIKPRIIAEELLDNSLLDLSTSIVDYKVWCFDGKPVYIMTFCSRSVESVFIGLYDLKWNPHPEFCNYSNHFRNGNGIIPKPASLDEMLSVATILAKDFQEIRIDFYDINGKLYFGEMTFTSGKGMMPYFSEKFQEIAGSLFEVR